MSMYVYANIIILQKYFSVYTDVCAFLVVNTYQLTKINTGKNIADS